MPPTWSLAVLTAVVVIVVVLAALAVFGLPPFGHAASAPRDETFAQAASAAEASAPGGPNGWSVFAAAGLDSTTSNMSTLTLNSSLYAGFGCQVKQFFVNGSSATLAAHHGALSDGTAPFWGMLLGSPTKGVFIVYVSSGSAVPLFQLFPSSSCSVTQIASTLSPSSFVDSPVAAAAGWNVAGVSFAAAHPGAGQEMELLESFSSASQVSTDAWMISYFACDATTPAQLPVASQTVEVSATNGTVMSIGAVSAGLCPFSTAFGPPAGNRSSRPFDVVLGTPTNTSTSPSNYSYSISVGSANPGIPWGDVAMSIVSGSGVVVSIPRGLITITSSNGTPVANYSLAQGVWTGGAGASISSGQTIQISTGSVGLLGDSLDLSGTGPYAGAVGSATFD